jgi:hypothetical protein
MRKIKEEITRTLACVAKDIKSRIQAYADKKGISFAEAEKRAYLTIDGEKIKPFTAKWNSDGKQGEES